MLAITPRKEKVAESHNAQAEDDSLFAPGSGHLGRHGVPSGRALLQTPPVDGDEVALWGLSPSGNHLLHTVLLERQSEFVTLTLFPV